MEYSVWLWRWVKAMSPSEGGAYELLRYLAGAVLHSTTCSPKQGGAKDIIAAPRVAQTRGDWGDFGAFCFVPFGARGDLDGSKLTPKWAGVIEYDAARRNPTFYPSISYANPRWPLRFQESPCH